LLDLTKLVGGDAFDVPCTLIKKGYSYQTHTLVDTGANGFSFIDAALADQLIRHCGASARPMPRSIPVTGFNGTAQASITSYIRLTFQIDGRRFLRLPFCIVPLGQHDLILGRTFFSYFHVNLDVQERRLLWPESLPLRYFFDKHIELTRESIKPKVVNLANQADADRRDQLFSLDTPSQSVPSVIVKPTPEPSVSLLSPPQESPPSRRLWTPTAGRNTYNSDLQRSQQLMDQQLKGTLVLSCLQRAPRTPLSPPEKPPRLDLFEISAIAYTLLSRQRQNRNEFFVASLDEIDRAISYQEPLSSPSQEALIGEIDYSFDESLVAAKLQEWKQYAPFTDVFSKRASDDLPPFRKNVDHKIELTGDNTLGHSPLYRMTTEELLAVKEYLLENLHKGFIAPSNAPFASPILFVSKPGGGLRFCIDFRKLNSLTKKDQHPLPLIDETLARISKAKIFTKLDIRQAFNRIRMDPDSEELTTFRTRYGTFKSKVLPFGLTNGPATYQRYMNEVLFDYLDDFCTAYLDDILIYSDDPLEHEEHVRKVLQRLREAGLQVDIKKTEFHVTRTKYLGFIISTDGIEVDPEKISAIVNWKFPTTVKGVQSFLGFCNFYRRFIESYGRIAKPLNELTRKDMVFKFTPDCQQAFKQLQNALTTAPLLSHYKPDLETQVETDASDGVIAGVMSQRRDEEWKPVGYFSKTMTPAELNYQIHDKEMLAIVKSLQQWRADLARTNTVVRVWTDHKSLEYFMTTKQLNQRQARWAEVLAEFYFTIAYRPGPKNVLADTLSRREQDVGTQQDIGRVYRTQTLLTPDLLDPRITAELAPLVIAPLAVTSSGTLLSPAQEAPREPSLPLNLGHAPLELIDETLTANKISTSLAEERAKAKRGDQDWSFRNDCLVWRNRLVVPDEDNLRTRLIDFVHTSIDAAHPGRSKTVSLLSRQFYWPSLRLSVETYIANCHKCRMSTVPRDRAPGFLHPLPVPKRPWQHLTMDYKSFLIDRDGYDNLLVVMDRLSKQSISIPCHKTIDARGMAELFLKHIWCREGYPDSIVSDRGPQFISSFWKEVCRILGIQIRLSTAFHPQTDGQTEIMNQYIDQRLRPFISHYQDNWSSLMPMMDYVQLTMPHETIHMSPFELLKGHLPRSTWDWDRPAVATPRERLNQGQAIEFASRMHDAWKVAKAQMKLSQEKKEREVNKHRRPIDWTIGDKVWVKTKNWSTDRPTHKLSEQMAGPFPVLKQVGHSYRLGLPSSMKAYPVFAAQNLRKAPENPLPGQANEPLAPIRITNDDEYEVQEIIAVKLVRKKLKYRAKWLGADDDPEWYPASDFKYSPHLVRDFHLANKTRPGPPAALDHWIQAWEDKVDDYDHLDNDLVADTRSRASFFRRGG
jgi:predicted aspartyl protease